jgi:hypothetical protein
MGAGPILDSRIEVIAQAKDGHEFPIELTIAAVPPSDPADERRAVGFSAFLRDITDRVAAEQEIRALNAELEERVGKRTRQLEAAMTEKDRLLEGLQSSNVELLDRLFELEHKSETIRIDLERAQIIQRALLPARPPQLDGVRVDALYRPGMKVGGDLTTSASWASGTSCCTWPTPPDTVSPRPCCPSCSRRASRCPTTTGTRSRRTTS